MKILLIDNYDSFTYNLYHYISNFKKNVEVVRNDKIDGKTILRKKYNKIVISPGPGNPNQSGNCLKIVKSLYKKIPILGVCLGHQIIGQVFGSKIAGLTGDLTNMETLYSAKEFFNKTIKSKYLDSRSENIYVNNDQKENCKGYLKKEIQLIFLL